MVAFYVRKIKNGDLNKKTEKPWSVEDVPDVWREQVEQELSDDM